LWIDKYYFFTADRFPSIRRTSPVIQVSEKFEIPCFRKLKGEDFFFILNVEGLSKAFLKVKVVQVCPIENAISVIQNKNVEVLNISFCVSQDIFPSSELSVMTFF
jgi:hypothetical protein